MTPLNSERDAAISILINDCGISPDITKETHELWKQIFLNDACFASQFPENFFNSKLWKNVQREIHFAENIDELKQIYFKHTKLQTHPQFLAELTGRKKRLMRKW